jgi:hypothetical protein
VTLTASTPALALAPGTLTVPGTGANTGHHPTATETAITRAGEDYWTWLDHIWPAAGCTHPVRLHGQIRSIDPGTGEILATGSTDDLPDHVIYKACGNRRDTTCPSCAETYRRDAYQLIRAGLVGGKGITPDVAAHPAVFATFTAPSFGTVHTRPVRTHTCTDRRHCQCRPQPCHARRDPATCPHGIIQACFTRHRRDGPYLGQPLCPDCYDYQAHVVWNSNAGELWRRTKQAVDRRLNQIARRRDLPPVRVRHGKAAEYQARGAVHFHALLRLDGLDPDDPDAILPPPPGITVADLDDAIRHAIARTRYRTPPHPGQPGGWLITWGAELDVRIITSHPGGTISDTAVASYLAKYSTKGTEPAGHSSARISPDTIGIYASPHGTHPERLIHACWTLGSHPDYTSLRRWAHMLGYGGHFLTKARAYSLRFSDLRQARITYRRTHDHGPDYGPVRTADHTSDETTLTVTTLTYTGTGWKTTGDALLANTAADLARRRRETAYDQLAA